MATKPWWGISGRYRIVEAVTVVGIALAFFAALLAFLRSILPTGSGLREGATQEGSLPSAVVAERSGRDLLLASGSEEARLGTETRTAATVLVRVTNTVKHRRGNAISWSGGRKGDRLRDGDSVQTFDRSTARIRFTEGNILDMSPNSLVVIQRTERDSVRSGIDSQLVMVGGELRGTLGAGDRASGVEVALPGGRVKIRSGTRDSSAAQFKINTTERRGSTIAVYRGVAELDAKGRTIEVAPNFASTIGLDGTVAKPVPLPAPPVLVEPVNDRTYSFADRTEKIRFSWKGMRSADSYHVVIARDPGFDDVVYDGHVAKAELRRGDLTGGTYYWRVSSVAAGLEGAFSASARLKVVQDGEGPMLEVHVSQKAQGAHTFTLSGRTEPGAQVFVGGRRIPVTDAGSFQFTLEQDPGSNVVAVRAEDAAGNVTYRSALVSAEF
jgi:hypothetical protein